MNLIIQEPNPVNCLDAMEKLTDSVSSNVKDRDFVNEVQKIVTNLFDFVSLNVVVCVAEKDENRVTSSLCIVTSKNINLGKKILEKVGVTEEVGFDRKENRLFATISPEKITSFQDINVVLCRIFLDVQKETDLDII